MEDKKISVAAEEAEEKETDTLTKEEILAMSREENKNGDEMQKSGSKLAARIAVSVSVVVACLVIALSIIFDKEVPMGLYIVMFALLSAYFIFTGIKGSRFPKFMLACGILLAICDAILIILWIIELCGIALAI